MGVGETLANMRQVVFTARAGMQDSTLLVYLYNMDRTIPHKIVKEMLMSAIVGITGGIVGPSNGQKEGGGGHNAAGVLLLLN